MGDLADRIGLVHELRELAGPEVLLHHGTHLLCVDQKVQDGLAEIPIEERPGDEVRFTTGLDTRNNLTTVLSGLPSTPTANYGFDVTPSRLVTGLITERGVCDASEEGLRSLFPDLT